MIKKIESYKIEDGSIYEHYEDAVHAKEKLNNVNNKKNILLNNHNFIKEYALKELNIERERFDENPLPIDNVGEPYYSDYYFGWDCHQKDNPGDKCIYIYIKDSYDNEECCVFCGKPEERK